MTGLLLYCLMAGPQSSGDLVREARQALNEAEQTAAKSGKACKDGRYEECNAMLNQTEESVERAKESLDKTGINPSRSPRHFKDAEIRVRKILKVLRDVASYIHPDDQRHYDRVVNRLSDINDQLLSSVMEKKKKKK